MISDGFLILVANVWKQCAVGLTYIYKWIERESVRCHIFTTKTSESSYTLSSTP